MSDDLYFISLISRALAQSADKRALQDAFRQICDMGGKPECEQGFRQFERLMELVANGAAGETENPHVIDLDDAFAEHDLLLLLGRGDQTTPMLRIPLQGIHSLEDVSPGHYQLALDTGRVLWERDLGEADLLWAHARPDQPLELAADTGEISSPATIEEHLLGRILVRVYRGIENGRIEIHTRFPTPQEV